MFAGNLRTGDVFHYVDPEEWLALSQRDKKRHGKGTRVVGLGPECTHDHTRVHIATSSGMWCVPFVAPVTRVQAASRPAKFLTPKPLEVGA